MKKENRRKRRSRLIDIVFLSVITILSVIALLLIIRTFSSSTSASPNKVIPKKIDEPKAEVIVRSTNSTYPGIKIVTETMDDKMMPFTIQYPQSEFEEFNKGITDYIEKVKKDYYKVKTESTNATQNQLNISLDTLQHSSGNYSFVLHTTTSTSNEESITEIRTFHIDPITGFQLTMADVVDRNAEKLKRVAKVVRDHIYKDPALQEVLIVDSVWQPTEPTWTNYRNFALTDDRLILYYGTGVMTKRQAGSIQVEVPLEKINSLVSKKFQVQTAVASPEKKIALTFDDGPDPRFTKKVLETLQKYNVKATFFMLGNRVEEYPNIAKAVAEAGHEIGNHSWNHPPLTRLTDEELHDEVQSTEDIILQATGQHATVFRPPYGAVNQRVRESSKLPVVLWNVDTLDWEHLDPDKLLENIEADVKHDSIVLMHDIHKSTAEGLDAVLEFLQAQGYTFATVSEMENY
ncbi:polysaccharide deacetylase family protein [Sporosarcina sp. GW1-11]|uniref:polysaccharide deacetylase family protein n=1 Tax=Sporosarcina sp. GW1-11 TaxID=2899126 RepID=UPI00294CAC8C|nr:polysaccharide deacetylase family protein [Sporosarcina sp. GW1-11]MDV6378100.1 polysaccharide deacetylase family protein [Sporosarcina sp. GW1-11]